MGYCRAAASATLVPSRYLASRAFLAHDWWRGPTSQTGLTSLTGLTGLFDCFAHRSGRVFEAKGACPFLLREDQVFAKRRAAQRGKAASAREWLPRCRLNIDDGTMFPQANQWLTRPSAAGLIGGERANPRADARANALLRQCAGRILLRNTDETVITVSS